MTDQRFPEFPAEHEFPTVIVGNTEDRPDDAPEEPKPVRDLRKVLEAGGWEVRIGYARAWRRGQRTGTFRVMESFGVFAANSDSNAYRVVSIYWRFADSAETYGWFRDTMDVELIEKAAGEPGKWTWIDSRIVDAKGKRNRVKVTDVKEFAKVRGSVLPSWFEKIAKRIAEQAAKALCGDHEEHESHTWDTTTGIMKICSGKATKPKETESV
jgi:hypothetical protein